MAWFILTWNPAKYDGITDDEWDEFAESGDADFATGRWSTGRRNSSIEPGDGLLFLRQGRDRRGIIALGEALTEVYEDEHYNDEDRVANYVEFRWTSVCTIDDRIRTETLLDLVPQVAWNNMQGSGVSIADEHVARILRRWRGKDINAQLQDDARFSAVHRQEGGATVVNSTRYERDSRLRAACIAHYGAVCSVCSFDFGRRYGKHGEGFIEVHHLTPLATLGGRTVIDPVADLRPLCSNCHSMVHRNGLLTPQDLKAMLLSM